MKMQVGNFYVSDEYPFCLVYECIARVEKPESTWFDNGTTGYLMRGPNPYGYDSIGDHFVDYKGEAGYGTGGGDMAREITKLEAAVFRRRTRALIKEQKERYK